VIERAETAKRHDHFPCHGCGAALEFSPGQLSLTCPYCGTTSEIPTTQEEVRELAYLDYFKLARLAPEVLQGVNLEVKCPKCAAVSEIPANVAADRCAFCGTPIENPTGDPTAMMRPQGVLPFRVEQREARTLFERWSSTRWFAPNDLPKMAALGQLNGLYVPYWTYDSFTITFYTGMRGDHYYVTTRDSKGNTRQERRTRWTPVSGRVDHWFDDVLVCASKGLPPKLVRDLEPWELHHVKDYKPELIAGFRVERYQIDAQNGFETAKGYMNSTIQALVRRQIGGDVQTITSMKTQYDGITFKHLLLPVWIAAYQYYNKTYRILVNAQTGEVQGERPWSWIKITLAVIGVLIMVALVLYFGEFN
jgi:ribosomal protein S27E